MNDRKDRLNTKRRRAAWLGMSLVELLTAMVLALMLLIAIGTLYADTIKLYRKADFNQVANKMAGVMLESMAREIRGAVRIEPEYNNVIAFPIDKALFPNVKDGGTRDDATSNLNKHYIAFTNNADPRGQVDFCFQYKKCDPTLKSLANVKGLPAIYYYGKTLGMTERFAPKADVDLVQDPPTSGTDYDACVRRFASDARIIIENFEAWRSPDGVVLRIQLTDAAFCNDRDWELDTGGNMNMETQLAFPKRPIVESSTFIAIRYYN
jgi:hypothetical protein